MRCAFDGTKIVENRKIKDLNSFRSDGYLCAQIEINSGLLDESEYSMQLTVDTNDGEAYYYTISFQDPLQIRRLM